jgi:hypothetical protein
MIKFEAISGLAIIAGLGIILIDCAETPTVTSKTHINFINLMVSF